MSVDRIFIEQQIAHSRRQMAACKKQIADATEVLHKCEGAVEILEKLLKRMDTPADTEKRIGDIGKQLEELQVAMAQKNGVWRGQSVAPEPVAG